MCIASIYRVTTERSNLTSQGTSVDRSIVLRRERWTNRRAGAIPLEPLSDEEEIYLNPLFECAGVGRGSAVAFCCVKPCIRQLVSVSMIAAAVSFAVSHHLLLGRGQSHAQHGQHAHTANTFKTPNTLNTPTHIHAVSLECESLLYCRIPLRTQLL